MYGFKEFTQDMSFRNEHNVLMAQKRNAYRHIYTSKGRCSALIHGATQ